MIRAVIALAAVLFLAAGSRQRTGRSVGQLEHASARGPARPRARRRTRRLFRLPITDAARLWAESWDASRLTLPEHQCRVHTVAYIYRGPLNLRIWEEKDPKTQDVIAIKHYISTYEQTRTIWMDGRPHPPAYAPHTWMGFSTGTLGGRSPDRRDDAHQAGLAPPQRRAAERPDDADRALHPARQHAYAHRGDPRPGLSERAAGQEPALRAQPARAAAAQLAVAVSVGRRSRDARARPTCRTTCRRESISRVVAQGGAAADRWRGRRRARRSIRSGPAIGRRAARQARPRPRDRRAAPAGPIRRRPTCT